MLNVQQGLGIVDHLLLHCDFAGEMWLLIFFHAFRGGVGYDA